MSARGEQLRVAYAENDVAQRNGAETKRCGKTAEEAAGQTAVKFRGTGHKAQAAAVAAAPPPAQRAERAVWRRPVIRGRTI